jgi:hypothetical protein
MLTEQYPAVWVVEEGSEPFMFGLAPVANALAYAWLYGANEQWRVDANPPIPVEANHVVLRSPGHSYRSDGSIVSADWFVVFVTNNPQREVRG